jgi:7-cyano-7-deazaguanine synthase in queuosine biosynthesis
MKILDFPNVEYVYDFSKPEFFTRMVQSEMHNVPFPQVSFFVNDDQIAHLFGSNIGVLLQDLIDIAMAVYLADRVSLRDPRKYHNENWVRNFVLKVGVRNPDFWNQTDVRDDVCDFLSNLTDDKWFFEFCFLSGAPELALAPDSTPSVALFSGGLDSFAGAAINLAQNPQESFVFVSATTHNRQISQQRKQIKRLGIRNRNGEIIHYTVNFGIKWQEIEKTIQEKTQRTRGFLYMTLGAVAAINAGSNNLEIYENGIGAINLPYDGSQISAMNSRSVNPITLMEMEQLIRKITDADFTIENKYLFFTKSEMCVEAAVHEHREGVVETFSCDGFPVHETGKSQCGVCTSCLLRRLSMETANIGEFDPGEQYGIDLTSSIVFPSFDRLRALRAMDWQYHQINRCLTGPNPWQELAFEFPELQTIVSELVVSKGESFEGAQTNILRLYKKYCDEWSGFSARNHLFRSASRAA